MVKNIVNGFLTRKTLLVSDHDQECDGLTNAKVCPVSLNVFGLVVPGAVLDSHVVVHVS